jgi:hypothetical protein
MKKRDVPNPSRSSGPRHWGRAQEDHIIDPYRWTHKPPLAAVCPQCGAVYQEGRWHWADRPAIAVEVTCQACHRANDKFPAGVVTLAGGRLARLKDQLIQLARHQEEAERPEHPLNRILGIEEKDGRIVISTSDIHLPRRIGEAIERAYKGELKIHFDKNNYFVRVDWMSPEA